MATSEFSSFGLAPLPGNILSPAAWAALPARSTGYPTGILPRENLNTALRQASSISAMIAAFTAAHQGANVLDDGDLATLQAQFLAAIQSLIASGSGTNRFFEAHNAVGLGGTGIVSWNTVVVSAGITSGAGGPGSFTIADAAGNGRYQLLGNVSMGYTGGAGGARGEIQFTKNGVAFGAPSLWIENNNTFEAASVTIPAQVSLVAGDVIRLSFTAVSGPCQVFTGYGNLTGYKI